MQASQAGPPSSTTAHDARGRCSQSVDLERRLFASILALGAALPILQVLLPEYVGDAVPVLIGVGLAATVSPLPAPQLLRVPVWGGVVMLLTPLAIALASPSSVGVLVFVPLGIVALTSSTVLAAIALGLAVVVTLGIEGVSAMGALHATSWSSTADAMGTVAILGWSAATVANALRTRQLDETSTSQAATANALDEAIGRDVNSLRSIAQVLADPSLAGPIDGAELRNDGLAMASRITSQTVLLGWLEGPPAATLSAGWALASLARAGQRCPRELMRFARDRLDEILPSSSFRWLAVWDRSTGELSVSPLSNSGPRHRMRLTPKGPRSQGGKAQSKQPQDVVGSLMPRMPDFELAPAGGSRGWVGAALGSAAAIACFFELPALASIPLAVALLVGHALVNGARTRRVQGLDVAEAQLQERAEIHDDLRFQIGRLHGGLLQYQVKFGDCQVTAHRLKGEVLEGSFAELVLDPSGQGHVLAGEVAGRGIAARFLGLAAQMIATHNVRSGRLKPQELLPAVQQRLGPLSQALEFPCELRLGGVSVQPEGTCGGWGILNRLVVVRGTSEQEASAPLARQELAATVSHATLDDDTRVYLSPSAAIPGPEDLAPALDRFAAADRLTDVVRNGLWNARESTLASLFSIVFDGSNAPAHGTLVELRTGSAEGELDVDDEDANGDDAAVA